MDNDQEKSKEKNETQVTDSKKAPTLEKNKAS